MKLVRIAQKRAEYPSRVAQVFNLSYRRMAFCVASANQSAPQQTSAEASTTPPIAKAPAKLALLAFLLAPLTLLGQSATNTEAISREHSVFNFGVLSAPTEAVSREISVFNFDQSSAGMEAMSRELSAFNFDARLATMEAISREVSVLSSGNTAGGFEAVSREISVVNFGQSSPLAEAISREVSIFVPTNLVPDLTVSILDAPATATAGSTVQLIFSITNCGPVPAVGPWTDQFLLSTNANGLFARSLGSANFTNLLEAGRSITVTQSVTLPVSAFGNYFVGVQVDSDGSVLESLEGNNTAFRNLSILEFLTSPVITQQPASRTVDSGAVVTFAVTATGSAPLSYQWQLNGVNLVNATNSTYVIANAQPATNGAYGVRVSNAGGFVLSSNAVLTVTPPDTTGPALTLPRFGAVPLVNGMIISNSDMFTINATDPSGVSRVEFYLDSALLNTDNNGADGFSAFLNIDSFPDGPHTVVFKAADLRNNLSTLSNSIRIALSPPPAPVIGTPTNQTVVSDQLLIVRGTGLKNTSVVLYINGSRVGTQTPVALNGNWETIVPLVPGTNRLQAAAQNRAGEGPRSVEVAVIRDISTPQPPNGLQAIAKEAGQIQLQWLPSLEIKGYHVYRGTKSFTDKLQASRLTVTPTPDSTLLDTPAGDAKYFYRVSAVNQANTEGSLSSEASATSDRLPPLAVAVSYHPETNYDAVTGRFGRTFVGVALQMSEPLQSPPFFSLTPNGGLPIIIDLRAAPSNQFVGTFAITENTPSGLANAVFSARDLAGNRGTEILSGGSILIDTTGPEVNDLSIQPSALIRNDSNAPVLVTFTVHLSEPVRTGTAPKFTYTLSATSPAERAMSSTREGSNSVTWITTLTLPRTAGLPTESLSLLFQGEDDIGNPGTRIAPVHDFQVYQGNLPSLESPTGLSAKAVPAGSIQLNWASVPEAVAYQIYRRGPTDATFLPLARAAKVLTFVDTPTTDGAYSYAVATVRQANGQEALSALGNIATAKSDRVPPGQPTNLIVALADNGVLVQWTPPPNLSEPVSYNLYRTNRAPISNPAALVPLIMKIPTNQVVDPNPTAVEPYYAVAAVDDAGNVSAPSNTGYQNVELLPIRTFDIGLTNDNPPVLSWTQSGSTIAGHKLYLGEDAARVQLGGLIPNSISSYTDTGYAGDDRRYTVATVDQNQQQSIGRSLRLPRLTVSLETNAIVKRGLMNHLTYVLTNASPSSVDNAQITTRIGGRDHESVVFSVAGLSSTNIPIVVGGYPDLPNGSAPLSTVVEIRPHDGELVSISRIGQVRIGDGQLIIGVMGSGILRGSAGSVQFSLFNPSPEEIEVITATASGANPSPDIRFTLLDSDGHVLSSTPLKSSVGNGIVNLPNGNSVLRLAPGAEIVSTAASLPIPSTTPDRVFVNVAIDKVYYHSDREDRVEMDGVQTRREFVVVETSYTGQVTAVTPAASQGDRPILISGSARFRANGQPAPNVPMLVKISNGGFERTEQVLTDSSGNFTTTFTPLPGEAGGVYSVWAVHPDLSDRTVQQTFVIQRVLATPTQFTVRAPYNFAQAVQLNASIGPGTTVTNLHLEYRGADQPDGALRPGITIGLGAPIPVIGPGQSAAFNLTFTGATAAPASGSVILRLASDGGPVDGWQRINVSYEFSEAKPSLRWSPNFVDTGVAPSNTVSETATFENVGLVSATGLRFSLVDTNGAAPPAWASINSRTNVEELRVGDVLPLALSFRPTNSTPEGDYLFVLQMRAQNTAPVDIGVRVAVLSTNSGGVLFKVLDMYSGLTRTNTNGSTFTAEGVGGAKIQLQNENVESFVTNGVTDVKGELLMESLPVGQYKFHVTADTHNSFNGRLWIRPGAIANQQVALSYSLVSVEWEVVPITIQDRYEIVLQATFETDVPAPVVTIEPAMVNLPQLFAGDVYQGEFSLFNHGLIRADHLQFQMPASDEFIEYEQLGGIPDHLDARQRLRVPYRVTCRKSFPGPHQSNAETSPQLIRAKRSSRPKPADTGATCYTYRAGVSVIFDYKCENGLGFSGGAGSGYYYNYTSGNCGGPSSGGGPIFGSGGGSGGGPSFSQGGTSIPIGPACFPDHRCHRTSSCDTVCYLRQGGRGSWVDLISREYQDEFEDLQLKIPGGDAKVVRQFYGNQWHWEDIARSLTFQQGTEGISSITRNLVSYATINSARTVFEYRSNRIYKQADGYRWQTREGDWELYDLNGRLIAAGKRNLTVTKYQYNPAGKLAGVTDRNDRALFIYNYAGDVLASIEDFTGRRVEYSYTGGLLAKVKDASGLESTYAYDGAGRMIKKTNVNGHVTKIAYDGGGYVYSLLDGQGNGSFFQYSYDKNTRQYYSQERTTGGQIKERRFDANGEIVQVSNNGIDEQKVLREGRTEIWTAATGVVTRREFDELGNLVKEIHPDGGILLSEYEPQYSQPVSIVDPRGAITLMAYDTNGNLTNKIEAAGTSIARTNSWIYNADNLLARKIDGRGNKMDYTYDNSGNQIREFDPNNPAYQTTYTYDARGNRIGVTNALGYATLYGYDNQNRLITETNALNDVTLYTYLGKNLVEVETGRDGTNRGRIVRYRYDDHDRRIQTIRVDEKDQEHVWETLGYDGDGNMIASANALGQTTRYEYNALGQRTKIIRPFSASETSDTQFVYDDFGRLSQEIDPLGVITLTEYDDTDRVRKTTEALRTDVQRSRDRAYDLNGNLVQIDYSDGSNTLSTFYDYDLLNRRTQIRGAREYPRGFKFDSNSNLIAEINGRGYGSEYAYDQYNRRTNTIQGVGNGLRGEQVERVIRNLNGDVIAQYNGLGNHRHYKYDPVGRRTDESIMLEPSKNFEEPDWWNNATNVMIHITLDPWGGVLARVKNGEPSFASYDEFGRLKAEQDAGGRLIDYSYDALDQITKVAKRNDIEVRLYDTHNSRLISVSSSHDEFTRTFCYDKRFSLICYTTPENVNVSVAYDFLNRPSQYRNPLGVARNIVRDQFNEESREIIVDKDGHPQTTRVWMRDEFGKPIAEGGGTIYPVRRLWDTAGNCVRIIDGKGNAQKIEYDARNRASTRILANGDVWRYKYDGNSKLTSMTLPDKTERQMRHNALGQVVEIDQNMVIVTKFEYDSQNRLRSASKGRLTNEFQYNSLGQTINEWQFNHGFLLRSRFDEQGRKSGSVLIRASSSEEICATEYTYTQSGRLETLVVNAFGRTREFRFHKEANSRRETIAYPDGLIFETTRDENGRPKNQSIKAGDSILAEDTFSFDALDRLEFHQRGNLNETVRYSYGKFGDLVEARQVIAHNQETVTNMLVFDYDESANRMSAVDNGITNRYTYDVANRATSVGSNAKQPQYNSFGSLKEYQNILVGYDELDQLSELRDAQTAIAVECDGLGRPGRIQNIPDGDEVMIVYSGMTPFAEIDGKGTLLRVLALGPDKLGRLDSAYGYESMIGEISQEGDVYYAWVGDGSRPAFWPHGARPVQVSGFNPFDNSAKDSKRFVHYNHHGRLTFSIEGIVWQGERLYNGRLGRWMSIDPIWDAELPNLYVFLRNDPVNRFDPNGAYSFGFCGWVCGIAGAALDCPGGIWGRLACGAGGGLICELICNTPCIGAGFRCGIRTIPYPCETCREKKSGYVEVEYMTWCKDGDFHEAPIRVVGQQNCAGNYSSNPASGPSCMGLTGPPDGF